MDEKTLIGGQAVIEGVMMRNGGMYGLAVRGADGTIYSERRAWFSLTRNSFLRLRFIRGFPLLVETLFNGISSLNRSAVLSSRSEEEAELKEWQLVLTLAVSVLIAVGLFVLAPHLMAMGALWLGIGGDVEGLDFHIWDGLFKFLIFLGYLAGIGCLPDIRRVFRYHGAEHKVIAAFESGGEISADAAAKFSREHPRCGTTFLLFVLSLAILLHAVLVPLVLGIWSPRLFWLKHLFTVSLKLLLLAPISALAYEAVRFTADLKEGPLARCLRAPGMCLQRLTTREPGREELEVAVAALTAALGPDAPDRLVFADPVMEKKIHVCQAGKP